MTEYDDGKTSNGILVGGEDDTRDSKQDARSLTLYTIVNRLIAAIFFPDADSGYASVPLLQRIKASLSDNIPLLRDASRNTARNIVAWTRRGSPLRTLLVVSVGTIALLSLTGFSVFLLFFVAATFNAVVISLLMSLAAAGGFLALFFTCIAAIYVGALAVAVFVISTTTITAVIAALIATGWIGFFWTLWVAANKCLSLGKRFFYVTGSAVSSYNTTRYAPSQNTYKKAD
ncbi:hypothetical protein F511_07320 [Dorcoceras hygrometricum]|uniref:Uncharacterized protein n=1 Tax=Dorcoceras hygrometricum TaxID=472368 RepID=A0A2Z7CYN2_9LAMI|nr:hypothetical protein F511_07320 [Dorcoceras hygrometricum]